MFTRRAFLRLLTLIASGLGLDGIPALGQPSTIGERPLRPDTILWMKRPAILWQDAFPVGNGRMGAMVFGGVKTERISLYLF